MKIYLSTLFAALLVAMTANNAYAADNGDVDDVTMDVITQSDPHAVTNDIELPTEANHEAQEHVSGSTDDSEHASESKSESHDSATEDANEDSHSTAMEDAHSDSKDNAMEDLQEDSQSAAEEQAHQAMQDATDTKDSKGD